MGKIAWIVFWVLVIWWVVANPTQAANAVHGVTTFLSSVVHGTGTATGGSG